MTSQKVAKSNEKSVSIAQESNQFSTRTGQQTVKYYFSNNRLHVDRDASISYLLLIGCGGSHIGDFSFEYCHTTDESVLNTS